MSYPTLPHPVAIHFNAYVSGLGRRAPRLRALRATLPVDVFRPLEDGEDPTGTLEVLEHGAWREATTSDSWAWQSLESLLNRANGAMQRPAQTLSPEELQLVLPALLEQAAAWHSTRQAELYEDAADDYRAEVEAGRRADTLLDMRG